MAVPPECYIVLKTKTASIKMNLVYMFMPGIGETYVYILYIYGTSLKQKNCRIEKVLRVQTSFILVEK